MPLRRLVVLASALGLATIGCAQPASAETWTVPHTATITVDGHGYGHGRGLSQYGAEHAATKGVGYREIVRYYYPGTTWGKRRPAPSGSGSATTSPTTSRSRARGGLSARRVGAAKSWNLDEGEEAGVSRWRILPRGRPARASCSSGPAAGTPSARSRATLEFAASRQADPAVRRRRQRRLPRRAALGAVQRGQPDHRQRTSRWRPTCVASSRARPSPPSGTSRRCAPRPSPPGRTPPSSGVDSPGQAPTTSATPSPARSTAAPRSTTPPATRP